MKKGAIIFFILILIASVSFTAYAADTGSSLQDSRKLIGDKAARGAKNIITGPAEIPKRIVDLYAETENPFWAILAGLYQGTVKAIVKTSSGIVDVVTCPVKSDEAPFIDPEIDIGSVR